MTPHYLERLIAAIQEAETPEEARKRAEEAAFLIKRSARYHELKARLHQAIVQLKFQRDDGDDD